MNGAARRWGLAILAAALLALAAPGMACRHTAWLLLPGLVLQRQLALGERPLRTAYGLGVLYMLAFSFSLRHVLLAGWLAIGAVGGGYFVLAAWLSRRLQPWFGPFGFGLALAAAHLLRAQMPEIAYPHGQPCHVFYLWPWLLGSVAWGGEALANLLLGAVAAALADCLVRWRRGGSPGAAGGKSGFAALLAFALATLVPAPAASSGLPAGHVEVLAVEPGLHSYDAYADVSSRAGFEQRYRELLQQRLLRPTQAALADAPAPALVLWPESSLFDRVDPAAPRLPSLRGLQLPAGTRLCAGASLVAGEDRDLPIAVLADAGGRYLDHHEKQCLVPAGEFLPFVRWLPASWAAALLDGIRAAMGAAPNAVAGSTRPPLRTADGVPFGALLCYDNAFPGPSRAQVEQGARFLCVLSNETWYRGGAELEQLLAQAVVRALETGTPLVRCTTDGLTAMVDGDGRIHPGPGRAPAPQPATRTCRFSVPLGPGRLPPMAWLAAVLPWAILITCLCALARRRQGLG